MDRNHPFLSSFASGVVVLLVIATLVVPVAAVPPPPPASYYGDLTINGEPAPARTTVTAYIDGEQRGEIKTNTTGSYGGPGTFDAKLDVSGYSNESGLDVTFAVNGVTADTTVEFEPGDHRQVNLAVSIEESSSESEGSESDDGSTTAPPANTATVEETVSTTSTSTRSPAETSIGSATPTSINGEANEPSTHTDTSTSSPLPQETASGTPTETSTIASIPTTEMQSEQTGNDSGSLGAFGPGFEVTSAAVAFVLISLLSMRKSSD